MAVEGALICDGCGQPLHFAPTRCTACKASITPGQAFRFRRVGGICEPEHVDCDARQEALL